jgi:hypothetical protein
LEKKSGEGVTLSDFTEGNSNTKGKLPIKVLTNSNSLNLMKILDTKPFTRNQFT